MCNRYSPFRRAQPALRGGRQCDIGYDDTYYAFVRESEGEQLLVVFDNAGPREVTVPVAGTPLASTHTLQRVFQWHVRNGRGGLKLAIAPGVAVFRVATAGCRRSRKTSPE